jgi:hypothetical protein
MKTTASAKIPDRIFQDKYETVEALRKQQQADSIYRRWSDALDAHMADCQVCSMPL